MSIILILRYYIIILFIDRVILCLSHAFRLTFRLTLDFLLTIINNIRYYVQLITSDVRQYTSDI